MSAPAVIQARSALEALRAGVPNDAAVRLLGGNEAGLDQVVLDHLARCGPALLDDRQSEGIVITGAFGAGKSHQLSYIAALAKQRNFIVSLVPISKETPLFDPARLFAAAIRTAIVPDANDEVLTAVVNRLQPNAAYDALEQWTTSEVLMGRLSAIFAALLYVIPRIGPDEQVRVARFLASGKLNLAALKTWLRDAGAAKLFDLKPVRDAELAAQRLRFAPRLFMAAGYAGWCVLLDEVELIGRYSPLQRGRSYAELARWLGLDQTDRIPGVATIAAITDDFTDVMFDRRLDDELIAPKLEAKGLIRQAAMARAAMAWLARRRRALRPPDLAGLMRSLERIAGLYAEAYGWTPRGYDPGPIAASRSMRQYIKSSITTWDVERLYSETPAIEAGTMASDYRENTDIENAPDTEHDDD